MGEVVASDDAGQDPQALKALLLLFVGEPVFLFHARPSRECSAPTQPEWSWVAPVVYHSPSRTSVLEGWAPYQPKGPWATDLGAFPALWTKSLAPMSQGSRIRALQAAEDRYCERQQTKETNR